MDMTQTDKSASFPQPKAMEQIVAKSLDQLDNPGRYSVIYEIARIDTLLGQAFTSDYSMRLLHQRAR